MAIDKNYHNHKLRRALETLLKEYPLEATLELINYHLSSLRD